jgi:hypothetical protein
MKKFYGEPTKAKKNTDLVDKYFDGEVELTDFIK